MPNDRIHCNISETGILVLGYKSLIIDPRKYVSLQDCINSRLNYDKLTIYSDDTITLSGVIGWHNSSNDLTVVSRKSIIIDFRVSILAAGNLILKSGIDDPTKDGTVIFKTSDLTNPYPRKRIKLGTGKSVSIYYNPVRSISGKHKYETRCNYAKYVEPIDRVVCYFLLNHLHDLMEIKALAFANYALSRDIDASQTRFWYSGRGFIPIRGEDGKQVFSGAFDGNGYTIHSLAINRPTEYGVGLFSRIIGSDESPSHIKNIVFNNCNVIGKDYIGVIAGSADGVMLHNITIKNSILGGNETVNPMGYGVYLKSHSITLMNVTIYVNLHGACDDYVIDRCYDVGRNIKDMEDGHYVRDLIYCRKVCSTKASY